jgi:haloacetate dehalogenase
MPKSTAFPSSISRRSFLGGAGATAAGAIAVSRGASAAVQAISADYSDGPGAVADKFLFPQFRQSFIKTSGATINTLVGGSGPPLLLLHGHPETHVAWHKVASVLTNRFTVVLTDLRGYGDSSKPEGGPNHINFSKREMANDQIEVMRALRFNKFMVAGHDRGARVIARMIMDHSDAVERAVVMDIAPTDRMYSQTNQEFATRYFWWFFQIQPAPLPELLIQANPELYLRSHLDAQSRTPGAVTAEAFSEYLRCYSLPNSVRSVCEDYRAAVSIDIEQTKADNGRKATVPLLALWGAEGTVGQLFDVLELWRQEVQNVSGHSLSCGHLLPEEDPKGVLGALTKFFAT